MAGSTGVLYRPGGVVSRHGAVMFVGHNPDRREVVVGLARTGSEEWLQSARPKVPAAALAVIELPIEHWREAAKTGGTLVDYATPKMLG